MLFSCNTTFHYIWIVSHFYLPFESYIGLSLLPVTCQKLLTINNQSFNSSTHQAFYPHN